MLLYGASGHAKVICSVLESKSISVSGIFDDNPNLTFLNRYKVCGPYHPDYLSDALLIIGIGDNHVRKLVSKKVSHRFGYCSAASSVCDNSVVIGEGTVVMQNVVIQRDASIGSHCIINTSASVDHECNLENYVHISPGAVLCGGVSVGEGTHIGAGVVVIQNVKIGKWCIIGAGAVIVNDIPDYSLVMGVPGRVIKKINFNG